MKRANPRHDSDCVAAALASILELPIEDVPSFWDERQSVSDQYEKVRRWLSGRGLHYYYGSCHARQFAEFQQRKWERGLSWPPRGYWIGQISRVDWLVDGDPNHVVVMRGHRCVYNPGGPLKGVKENDVFLIGYYLLVPLDPAIA
jgi:hypothetical protein